MRGGSIGSKINNTENGKIGIFKITFLFLEKSIHITMFLDHIFYYYYEYISIFYMSLLDREINEKY